MPQNYDAILFDMDGLMIDTERISMESWRRAADELDMALSDQLLLDMVGLSMRRCTEFLSERLGSQDDAVALQNVGRKHYWQMLEHEEIPLKRGIEALLDWALAQSLPRAVATSTQRQLADIKLGRTGLSRYFDTVVAGDEVAHTKPAPDVYLAAARKLGVDPLRCVVLEDSIYGLHAGVAAGMRVILVPDLVTPPADQTHQALAVCKDLHQALDVLRQLA
ncbi:hydrolase [Chromobacterium haemolyticum]|uniref:HAD family hydrolase n=1 Tax=Chromobacterium haemolyticum TaxID=394935 RepID=UPI0009DA533E|nr:HAD family phosphatase [Chromobacterium haemolyticum]OQS40397.1 hydrolase [Chromobacterium haemolyticum]